MPPVASTGNARYQLSFPLLREEEVLYLLADLQFPMTYRDLTEANADQIRYIYATFCAESCELLSVYELLSERYESITACFRVSHYDVHCVSLPLLTLYCYLRQVFSACKVPDFYLSDIVTPTKKRFILLFSALTNFLRFKSMLGDFVTAQVEKYRDGRAFSAVLRADLEAKRGELQAVYESYSIIKPTLQEIEQAFSSKNTDFKVRSKELQYIQQQIQLARSEFGKKERECNTLYRQMQLIQEQIYYIYAKIISPDAPERLKKQGAQFSQDVQSCQKRIGDFQRYILEIQEKALAQQEIDQNLSSLSIIYYKAQQDRLYLQETQQQLEMAQMTVQQLQDEQEEIHQFEKYCAQETAKLHSEEEQFMRELKSESTQNDILKNSKEIAELQERNAYLETNIQIMYEQNEAAMRERNYLRADVFKKQETLVDQLNQLIKAYCVQMQEMNQLFDM